MRRFTRPLAGLLPALHVLSACGSGEPPTGVLECPDERYGSSDVSGCRIRFLSPGAS